MSCIVTEIPDSLVVVSQNFFDLAGGTVATTNPYDFGWKASYKAPLVKVRILRDNRVSVGLSEIPDRLIVRAFEAHEPHMSGIWVEAHQTFDNATREILIEE